MALYDAEEKSILIVEDTPITLSVLHRTLEECGYRICPALNAEVALNFIEKFLPDLILLDIMMPGIDGYELCRRLKREDRTRDIPVIFLSALDGTLDKLKAFEAGGVDYISKPFQAEEVLMRVKTHLKLCSAQQRLQQQNAQLQQEIHERKRMEQHLRRLEKAIETTEIGITISDPDGMILYTNPADAKMHGYQTQEIIGQSSSIFSGGKQHDQPQEQAPEDFEAILPNTKRIRQNRRKDLSEFPAELISSPIYDNQGKYLGRVTVCEDISERRQAEQDLQRAKEHAEAANRAKSIFLANMSHELRTPLNSILGFSQLILNRSAQDEETLSFLRTIKSSGEHLLNLINDVLDYSKIEALRTSLNISNFDLFHLLDDVVHMFRLKIQQHPQLRIVFDRDEDVPQYVHTDEVKLRQVLINLLHNAVKFTEQGTISLNVTCGNKTEEKMSVMVSAEQAVSSSEIRLYFELKDTGIGIAPEEMGNLFEAFVQTSAGKRFYGGTGLGLPISRKFVQLMGGDISVSSRPAEGSLFAFTILCHKGRPPDESERNLNLLLMQDKTQPPLPRCLSDAEMQESLAALDPELLRAFEHALVTADISEIRLILEQIGGRNSVLRDRLHTLVENFDYVKILKLLGAP